MTLQYPTPTKDPYGPVTKSKLCMFRRCACVDENGDRRVCVPPSAGWMCERKAMMLKKEITLGMW